MIKVYDGLVRPDYIETINSYVQHSYFTIGWQDGNSIYNANHRYFHSKYSEADLHASGFIEAIQGTEVGDLYNRSKWVNSVVNVSVPSDSNFLHTHQKHTIILYYINTTWDVNWGGETVFYDDDMKNVRKSINILPGRIVVFDGNILHSVRPQQAIAPHYRFTLATVIKE